MPNSVLPTSRHARELIEHAEKHLLSGSNLDMKIALIHADNSIEVMIKEHLRYSKEKSWGEIEHMNFYELLKACIDINLVSSSKSFFLAYHDMRNAVYHTGTLVPTKEDVESTVGFAKTLFNELHPSSRFIEARIELPSDQTIQATSNILGFQPHMTELLLEKEFSNHLVKNGYEVLIESAMPDGRRADLLAQKNGKSILCEFKIRRMGMVVGLESAYQLKSDVDMFRRACPGRFIEGWLITNARFSKNVENVAKTLDIHLFDRQKLKRILSDK